MLPGKTSTRTTSKDNYEQSPLIEEIGIFGVSQEAGELVAAVIFPSEEIRKKQSIAQATSLLRDKTPAACKGPPRIPQDLRFCRGFPAIAAYHNP